MTSNKRARYDDDIVQNGVFTTAAEGFFEALVEAGVTHCFVNLGSDHPAMLEAMIKAKQGTLKKFPNIITCPSELVALSAALGYAQVTGIPQCVLVHVDCGTLALGQSIHNASIGRVPVLCFAGLSPFTQRGELLGSRTEFIHWLQDVPDQAAIVRQYCRYSGEIKSGRNIKEMVNRALQFTLSDPKGPAYLMAAREVLEEKVDREFLEEELLSPIVASALPEPGNESPQKVELIAKALMGAQRPLVITGYLGRNHNTPPLLEELCDKLPINVVEMVGSDVCIRSTHEAYLGVTVTTHPAVLEADVILILDCDVPWIPTAGHPRKGTKIFHLDVDPLKQQMPLFSIRAIRRLKVSSELALKQLNNFIDNQGLDMKQYAELFEARRARYNSWRANLKSLESPPQEDVITVPYLASRLRDQLPQDTTFVLEAVTNAGHLIHHLNLTKPGSLLGSGAGGLGWGGGATLGTKLAKPDSFVCGIVGDGVYLFSQMESVYWIARRYDVPFLLIVLNNGGWNAPKVSALLVHEHGLSSKANRKDLNISFEPSPDYPGIAKAAGNAWGGHGNNSGRLGPCYPASKGDCQSWEMRRN
ncbi:Thiamine pyrophosphate enzyme C-terminal TPP-binding [Penicillium hetheringtonii]|uniref:Thiamine pyrophosphate enzyme C-terminal TPP-binding n=1 Tax=Penicillium hetheringtonii TaxID=911720 RepID=A0AAD6D983_9EURO|nr:Thiamine pyrophosphate enzyme C-terminal TPP-binding [Penicillium hetheringtonii]